MKRLHVHVGVKDLKTAIDYYSALFGEKPVKVRADYAKWSPADLDVNFAISVEDGEVDVGHLGVEVQEDDELASVSARLEAIEAPLLLEGEVKCCYARSRKTWSEDPSGVRWELFNTIGESEQLAPELVKN